MSKFSKIILIIGVLCMLVPFMVLGSTASAEEIVFDNYVAHSGSIINTIGVSGSSVYTWTGSPYFTFDFPSGSTALYFNLIDGYSGNTTDDYLELSFNYSVPVDDEYETVSVNMPTIYNSFRFGTSSYSTRTIYWANDDYLLHYNVLLFYTANGLSSSDVSAGVFSFNGISVKDLNSYNLVEFTGSTYYTRYAVFENYPFSIDLYLSSSVNYSLPDTYSLYALSWFSVPSSDNYLRAKSGYTTDYYVLGLYDIAIDNNQAGYLAGYNSGLSAGQQIGYDNGFTAGQQQANNTVNTGSASYVAGETAGKQQANNTVNTGSASYIQGYQDGLDAPEYSFMSLISAIIDAPIRAFFGYTENGVTHPGLFNFNILGYDMSNLVLSIFSLCVLLTILRFALGGK